MKYVKQFNINGIDTRQVACIELKGKPNAATEGAVGVLGIDITSPTHDMYKCVAVNGAIYTWELFSNMDNYYTKAEIDTLLGTAPAGGIVIVQDGNTLIFNKGGDE